MKRALFISSIFLVALLVLTGCSNKLGNGNQTNNQQNTDNSQRGRNRMPDFGQPKEQPDIRGIVKSIVGNQVTVLKLDRPQNASEQNDETKKEDSDTASGNNAKIPVRMGGTGMMMGGPGGRPGGEDESSTREDMLERIKAMSTGEETITIPVGIQMLKPSSDGSKKMEMVEASLSDIAADKSITVWLNKDITDKKVASFVLVN